MNEGKWKIRREIILQYYIKTKYRNSEENFTTNEDIQHELIISFQS